MHRPGDKVLCIKSIGSAIDGKIYEIDNVYAPNSKGFAIIYLKHIGHHYARYFIKPQLKDLLAVRKRYD